jgi:hypothetical protein
MRLVRRQVGCEAVLLARMRVWLLAVAAGLPVGLQNTAAEAAGAARLPVAESVLPVRPQAAGVSVVCC